jgi:hypothetical protein
MERELRILTHQFGEGSLARTRRSPKDHWENTASAEGPREKAVGIKEVCLPHQVFKLFRPDPLGQGDFRIYHELFQSNSSPN